MSDTFTNKAQYGRETVRQTAVPATKMFLGSVNIPKDIDTFFAKYKMGVRGGSMGGATFQQIADGFTLELSGDKPAYFQAMPMILSLLLKGGITPTVGTSGQSDYLWTFTPSLTGDNTPDTITLELGGSTQEYEIEGVMAKSATFKGVFGENSGLDVSMQCFGKQIVKSTYTAALPIPTIEMIPANLARLFMDTSWSGKGTTQMATKIRDFEIEIQTGHHPIFHGGAKTFDAYGEGDLGAQLRMTFESDANAVAIWDAYHAHTKSFVTLKAPGPQIGTGTYYRLQIDLAGEFSEVIPLASEKDGDNLYTAIFNTIYDTTGAAVLAASCITNNVAI